MSDTHESKATEQRARAPFRAAVVQAAPILKEGGENDTAATVVAAEEWIATAASQGAKLVVFPEAYIGGYPKGSDFGIRLGTRSDEGRAAFAQYFAGAIDVPGPEVERLCAAAGAHGVEVVIGVIERGGSTLYCTVLYIGSDGSLRGKHRKLVPTALERCVWGRGDGSTLIAADTPLGKIGAAICWENYMPLYRMSLYEQGVEMYCAPTVDDREVWQATMRHIAVEGRSFVFSACQFLPGNQSGEAPLIRGGSVMVDPFGKTLAGPLYGEAGVLYADVDPSAVPEGRFDLDVIGHYARPDLFEFRVRP